VAGVERSEPPETKTLGARYAGPQPADVHVLNRRLKGSRPSRGFRGLGATGAPPAGGPSTSGFRPVILTALLSARRLPIDVTLYLVNVNDTGAGFGTHFAILPATDMEFSRTAVWAQMVGPHSLPS
jgi:hypothetical protein